MTSEEGLLLHNEVIALQNREGISYTAAARELYLIEVAKHGSAIVAREGFDKIKSSAEQHYPEHLFIESIKSDKSREDSTRD